MVAGVLFCVVLLTMNTGRVHEFRAGDGACTSARMATFVSLNLFRYRHDWARFIRLINCGVRAGDLQRDGKLLGHPRPARGVKRACSGVPYGPGQRDLILDGAPGIVYAAVWHQSIPPAAAEGIGPAPIRGIHNSFSPSVLCPLTAVLKVHMSTITSDVETSSGSRIVGLPQSPEDDSS